MSVIGFDFGYQTCFIAVARQGGIETVANEFSDRLTPAIVSLGEKQRSIGGPAKTQMISNLKNTIWGWKKLIGRKFSDPQVQRENSLMPYEVVEGPNGYACIKVSYLLEQQAFTPQQITAMMFTKLKHTAEVALKTKVVDVVISVPCYFTDIERRAMLDSAQVAGLNVLRLMNDTTATALAYGIYKKDLPAAEEKPRVTVFLDMGHSDLQMSAVAFNKAKLKVLATAADLNLGGRDFDMLLAEHFAKEFKTRYKIDAKSKPKAYVRLLTECEKIKKLMSANATDIPLNIECFMEDKDVTGKINRTTMEEMSAGLMERARQTMIRLLQATNLKPDEIYAVEIVGGSSRIPAVKNMVKEIFGLEPSTTLNADEAVARGCALQCAILSPNFRVRDFNIIDSQPYPISLCWAGSLDEGINQMEVFNMFHQAPFSKMLTFYRQEPFSLEARYSTNHIPHPCTDIGSFSIKNVVPQAGGESSRVKVKVRVNVHGIFTVSSASMVEKTENATDDQEPMDVEDNQKEGAATENKQNEDSKPPPEAESEQPAQDEAKNGDAAMDTDQKENGAKKTDKDSEKKDDKKGDKKKKVKVIDLPIIPSVAAMSLSEINDFMEKEGQMISNDKLEKEKADAKNGVEEYVYEMRDKLYNELDKFVKEEDRDGLILKLEDTENWIYDEGEDQKKQVYLDRLADLKKSGQPIVDRFKEFQNRPAAFESFGAALQKIRKVVDVYDAQDEIYAHLEAKEMDKVKKCLDEKTKWFDKNVNLACNQKPYDNPVVLVSEVYGERDSMYSACNPIISKPKPKPKEEPPKEEKKEEKTDDKAGAKPEGDAPQDQPMDSKPAENCANSQGDAKTEDMDLD